MPTKTAVALSDAEKINNMIEPLVQDFEAQDPNAVSAEIALRVLGLSDLDEILDAGEATTISAEDIGARSFKIISEPRWLASKFKANENSLLDYFAIVNVQMEDDGSEQVLTIGGTNACAQLVAAQRAGKPTMGGTVLQFKSVPTASGYNVLWFKRGEERF